MPTVLALEPDDRRTDFLRAVVCEQLRACLVVAATRDAAIAAVSACMPDVVLVSPDFPPREEIEIKDYLRSLQRSTALEILKMPAPSHGARRTQGRTGLLGTLRRRAAGISEESPEREDFAALADRITGALDRVKSAKANATTWSSTPQPLPEQPATRGPDPGIRTAADWSKPVVNLDSSRSDAGAGKPQANPATPATAAGAPPDAAGDNQNEWGFFDPGRCGYAALAATLDTVPEVVQQNVEPSPADMLLKFETGADAEARREPPSMPESAPTFQEAPTEAPTAACQERRRDRPAPLALWAHLFGWEGEHPAPRTLRWYTEVMAGVAALLIGLNIPVQIAGVAYGSGCRVRRVRGLARTGLTAPATFDVASSQPDSSSICHPTISEPSPVA